jgi:hypothetical protein
LYSFPLKPELGIRAIFVWIRIRCSKHPDPDPDPGTDLNIFFGSYSMEIVLLKCVLQRLFINQKVGATRIRKELHHFVGNGAVTRCSSGSGSDGSGSKLQS